MLFAMSGIEILNAASKGWFGVCFVAFLVFWFVHLKADPVDLPYGCVVFMTIFALIPLGIVKLICWMFNIEGFWI